MKSYGIRNGVRPTITTAEEGTIGLVAGDKGAIFYNTDTDSIRVWDGTAFQEAVPAEATPGLQAVTDVGNTTTLGIEALTYNGLYAKLFGTSGVSIGNALTGANATGFQSIHIGAGSGENCTARDNITIGHNAGKELTSDSNVAIGYYAHSTSTNISKSIAIGKEAGLNSLTSGIFIGPGAGEENTGGSNLSIGIAAGGNQSGANSIAIGSSALLNNTYNQAIGIGVSAGQNNTGLDATMIGRSTGDNNTGDYVVSIGTYTGRNNSGNYTVLIGDNAGTTNISDNLVAIGRSSSGNNRHTNATFIGAFSNEAPSKTEDIASRKTFDFGAIDIASDSITVSAHGFGDVDDIVSLYWTVASIAPTSLGMPIWSSWKTFKVIDSDTLQFTSANGDVINIASPGTGTGHTLGSELITIFDNVSGIGFESTATKDNQIVLGNSDVVEVKMGNGDVIYPSNAVKPGDNTEFTGVTSNAITVLSNSAANVAWTGDSSNLSKLTLSQDSVLDNPSAPIVGAIYQIIVEQDSTGLWTLGYGTMFKFPDGVAPVIDLNANSKGILTALYDGTDLLVVSVQNFL